MVGVWIFFGTIQYGKLAAMVHVLQDAMYTGLDHEPFVVLQRKARKCTTIYNMHVHAWPLFCSLII